jgi:hypothetical protein
MNPLLAVAINVVISAAGMFVTWLVGIREGRERERDDAEKAVGIKKGNPPCGCESESQHERR